MDKCNLNSGFSRKFFGEYLMSGLFLCSLFAFYPLIWPRLIYKVDLLGFFTVITPATVTLLMFGGCFFKLAELKNILKHNLFFSAALAAITGVILSHLFTVNYITLEDIATAFVWIAVPLFVVLYHRHIGELLPYFMALLWMLNCWQIVAEQVWCWNSRMIGVTGNNNWSAALMIVSTAFLLQLIWVKVSGWKVKQRNACFTTLALPISLIAVIILYRLYSKGANISLLAAAILMLLIYYGKWQQRSFKIILLLAGICTVFILVFIVRSDGFASFVARDVRLPLWTGALRLILDNSINGVSPVAFESGFAPYVPVDYYLRGSIAALRNVHPHSHLLYFAASFGLIATIAWVWLIIRPVVKQVSQRQSSSIPRGTRIIYLFSFFVLLIHGMVDLTLFSWPCGYIFLIIVGLLWHDCWKVNPKFNHEAKVWVIIGTGLGVLLLGYSIYIAYLNGVSSYLNRQALIQITNKQPQMAFRSCNESLAYKTTHQALYRAAIISLFDLKDPQLALGYLERFDQTPYKNYINNNGLRARALCVIRQPSKALPFFDLESKNYPISSLNWHFYYYTLKMLNLEQAALIAKNNLLYSLEVKAMTLEDIPLLIKNPKLDITFTEGDGKTPKIKRLRQR